MPPRLEFFPHQQPNQWEGHRSSELEPGPDLANTIDFPHDVFGVVLEALDFGFKRLTTNLALPYKRLLAGSQFVYFRDSTHSRSFLTWSMLAPKGSCFSMDFSPNQVPAAPHKYNRARRAVTQTREDSGTRRMMVVVVSMAPSIPR